MSATGPMLFEHDEAMEAAAALRRLDPTELFVAVEEVLEDLLAKLGGGEYLDLDSAMRGLVAAALVAEALHPGALSAQGYVGLGWTPEELRGLQLLRLPALEVATAIIAAPAPTSQWASLWEEAGNLSGAIESASHLLPPLSFDPMPHGTWTGALGG